MTYPASTIAFALVTKAIEQNIFITLDQLQRMIYFANGFHLARYRRPLIAESFEAWRYGPILPVLFRLYLFYGKNRIFNTGLVEESERERDNIKRIGDEGLHAIDYTIQTVSKLSSSKEWKSWANSFLARWTKSQFIKFNCEGISNRDIAEYFSKFFITP